MIEARRVEASASALADPGGDEWARAQASPLSLQPTPLASQPSVYVQAKWKAAEYGSTEALLVQALHNGDGLFFRLQWDDESRDDGIRDTDQFADAAAVLFPVDKDAPLASMGSPQQPVNAWYWRPDLEAPYSVIAQGTGTTQRTSDPNLTATGVYGARRWTVVIGRALRSRGDGLVQLTAGRLSKVAFAVWQGSNGERAGLKAVTADWEQLELEL